MALAAYECIDELIDVYEHRFDHTHLPQPPAAEHVYLYGTGDRVLYVGITTNPAHRLIAHRNRRHHRDSFEVVVRPVSSRRVALGAEAYLIHQLRPSENADYPKSTLWTKLTLFAADEFSKVIGEVAASLETPGLLFDNLVALHGWHSWDHKTLPKPTRHGAAA